MRLRRSDKRYGLPKWVRRYATRYGSDAFTLMQTHKKFPTRMLDNARDRRERLK